MSRGTPKRRPATPQPPAPSVPAEVAVTAMGAQGDGLAMGPSGPVFVPLALPGETVRGGLSGDRLALEEVLVASPERVAPDCRHFGRCGGCLLQHWDHVAYLAWKRALVVEALRREGLDPDVAPIIDAHGAGRRRVILHVRRYGTRTVIGFAERGSHAMVDLEECPVLAPALLAAIPALREVAQVLVLMGKPMDFQATLTDTGLDLDIRGTGPLPPARLMDLAAFAERFGFSRITRHGEMVIQRAAPVVTMGRARVDLPPAAFLQATQEGEGVLSRLVLEAVAGARSVADLFAGVGTFALRMAEEARVFVAESNAPALNALLRAGHAPGLRKIEGEARDLFRFPLPANVLGGFDAVVIDPPRQGAEAQARELAASPLKRLVYVSCNAQTFARDARVLTDGGFRLERVTPVDQFRHSPHVELVARFSR